MRSDVKVECLPGDAVGDTVTLVRVDTFAAFR